jgi:outer membrane protein assembly factor BamE
MRKRTICIALGATLLAGCSISDGIVHRIDIRQGTLIEQEQVDQLKTGMSRQQVAFLLGTPLITDPFHTDRWDYVYRFAPGNGDSVERQQLSLRFRGDRLSDISGTLMPRDNPPPVIEREEVITLPGPGEVGSQEREQLPATSPWYKRWWKGLGDIFD